MSVVLLSFAIDDDFRKSQDWIAKPWHFEPIKIDESKV